MVAAVDMIVSWFGFLLVWGVVFPLNSSKSRSGGLLEAATATANAAAADWVLLLKLYIENLNPTQQ